MNCLIYVRVSTEEQKKKGYSIDAQTDRCIKFAEQENYNVVKVFKEEGRSAKNLNRPVLQEMFKYIKKNHKDIDALIFWKWDRLSRGEDADYVDLGLLFDKYTIKTLSVEENNENSPEAKLMRKITRATSAYELDKDSQRTKLGMHRKAEEGYPPFKAPIGYINEANADKKRTFIIDDKNAFYVRQIFNYYSTGMYSLESLGEKMFLEGFKNKYGKPYPARKFEEILKNISYTGDFKWGG